jgi:hypothetical protein
MRLLRNFVRFCFGIQALGFVTSLLSLSVVLIVPQRFQGIHLNHVVFGPMLAASLVMAVFDGASAIAWWTLRTGKPSGRRWAIAASIMNLPIPILSHLRASSVIANVLHVPEMILGTLLAVAGLIAFLPRGAAAQVAKSNRVRPPQSPRMAGDGTSKLQDYVGQGISIAIVWFSLGWWGSWATHHQLSYPGLLAFLAQMELAVLITTLTHELGHLVAGWASGEILRSFQVGPFRWTIRHGVWKFDFNLRRFYGGSVAMVAPDLVNMRSRQAFLLIGGPVGSLLTGSIFIVAALLSPGHAWQEYWMFLSMLATFSIAAFVGNLIPMKPASLYSDGAQLYQIVTNGPWTRVHLAFAMVTSSLVSRLRPRDFDVNLIHQAANSLPQGERGLLLRLFACIHYLDANQIPKAIASMEEAEALYEQSVFEKPQEICAEFVFVNAFYKRDLAAAERWSRRIEAARNVECDADYWRAQTAFLWLKGEREEACDAWARGHVLALKLPMAGSYDFTRSCFAKLRAALDAPAQTSPPPLESLLALAAACDDAESRVEGRNARSLVAAGTL